MSTAPSFRRLALVGIGLIGSSIAHATRRAHAADHIAIHSRTPATLRRAEELGLGDSYHADPADAVRDADAVILSIPVGASGAAAEAIAPRAQARRHRLRRRLGEGLGGRPGGAAYSAGGALRAGPSVAGTEYSGPDAGFAALFDNRWCILTPPPGADPEAVETLHDFWKRLGANVEVMTPEHHDLVLAITSHVPHLIAYNIVGTAAHLESVTQSEVMKFSAGGFRDFTRIASSDPTMWRDVFLNNREAVLEMLGRFTEDLTALQRNIRYGEGDMLFELFTRTRAIRRGIIAAGQETEAPDFGRLPGKGGEAGE
jgi:cyclohexadieny/prephenate dehydrogenase